MAHHRRHTVWQALAWGLTLLFSTLLIACGEGGSSSADLPAPTITAQPSDVQVTAGTAAEFSVTVQDGGASFSWQRSNDGGITWAAIAGADAARYTLASPTVADNGARLRVVVSSGGAQSTSSAVTLTVTDRVLVPTIEVAPASVLVPEGGDASFSVTASGTGLTYRWQLSSDGSTWTDAEAGSAATLRLIGVPLSRDQWSVRVLVGNSAGQVITAPVTLTVQAAPAVPAITAAPQDQAVVAPTGATFRASASGSPAPSWQWARSIDGGSTWTDLPGATAATYTTPATTVADSGSRFRVTARNDAGSSTSAAALLTVSAAVVAPAITTQPADASVSAGQQVSISAAASGTPTPALQWQTSSDGGSTWVNINGATADTTSLTAALNDNGRRLRMVATNSQGTATSRAALITVSAAASALQGRAWSGGTIAGSGSLVLGGAGMVSALDDRGRSIILFSKLVGDRLSLHAVHGEPGAAGGMPVYGEPMALEPGLRGDPATGLALAVSPAGQAVAMWNHQQPCADEPSRNCVVSYVAQYRPATGRWDSPSALDGLNLPDLLTVNDNGDIAARVVQPSTTTGIAVAWRAAGQSAFSTRSWPLDVGAGTFFPYALNLDHSGRLLVAGTRTQPGSTLLDIAVVRGTLTTGLDGAVEVIDQRGASAAFRGLWGNGQGQALLVWSQDNGVRASLYAATLDSAAGSWGVVDTGETPPPTNTVLPVVMGDDGEVHWYLYGRCALIRRSASGVWTAATALPAAACQATGVPGTPALARNGLLLTVHPTDGSWLSYDPRLNAVVTPRTTTASSGPGYLLGVPQRLALTPGNLLLNPAGVGHFSSVNAYDVLPTVAAPNGDSRGINSVWAWYHR